MTRIFHWSFMWKMDPTTGCNIRLVFTLPPRDSKLQYKISIHLWNNVPCIITLAVWISSLVNYEYVLNLCSEIRIIIWWKRYIENINLNWEEKRFIGWKYTIYIYLIFIEDSKKYSLSLINQEICGLGISWRICERNFNCDPPFKDDNAQFTTVPLKTLSNR